MFRTLFILCLVVFTTFAFPAENNDSSLGQDIGNEPIVTVPAPIKKSISLQDVYEPCKTPFVTQNYNPNWVSKKTQYRRRRLRCIRLKLIFNLHSLFFVCYKMCQG
jgi:hypothetical protein